MRCRLCVAEDLESRFVVRGHTISACRACGLVQAEATDEQAAAVYDADYHDRGKYVDDAAGRREQDRRLAVLECCGVRAGARVLDVGCATGDFVGAARWRFDMWGTDVSEHAIAQARQRWPGLEDRFQAGLPGDLGFEPRSFDAVVLWDVVEHLTRPLDDLLALTALLKDSGVIAFTTPNAGALTARAFGKRWAFMTPPEHLSFFDRNTAERLVRDLGAEVITWSSRGKWVNSGFFLYKLRRVFPELIPQAVVARVQRGRLGRLCLYVPTGDVMYVGARLQGRREAPHGAP